MKMNSQNDRVLKTLKQQTLTAKQASIVMNIWRLSARIYDLREKGFNIKTEWLGNGSTRYARYRYQHGDGTG